MKTTVKNIFQNLGEILLLTSAAIPVGAAIGAVDSFFGQILLKITNIRDANPLYYIPFLPLAGIIIAYCYQKFGGKSSKGMNLVFEVGNGDENAIPLRLIPFVMSGTWLTHLFGGSAGREGVAVQIGATISHFVGKRIPVKNAGQIFLVAGMAAGFAGLFGTPIAAVLFAVEVLTAGEMRYQALLPTFAASFTASTVARFTGLEKFTFALRLNINLTAETFFKLLVIGVIFGIVGGAFALCLKFAKNLAGEKLKNPIIRIAVIGVALSILFILLWQGRYSGLGTNLINSSLNGETIYTYDWILKFALTVITLAAGFQGGEVTPLFAIGASLGAVLACVFNMPTAFVAALGYAAVFGSATNTLFAPIFIGGEVFGFEYMPYFFIVCAIAYVFNMNKSIYTLQKVKKIY